MPVSINWQAWCQYLSTDRRDASIYRLAGVMPASINWQARCQYLPTARRGASIYRLAGVNPVKLYRLAGVMPVSIDRQVRCRYLLTGWQGLRLARSTGVNSPLCSGRVYATRQGLASESRESLHCLSESRNSAQRAVNKLSMSGSGKELVDMLGRFLRKIRLAYYLRSGYWCDYIYKTIIVG